MTQINPSSHCWPHTDQCAAPHRIAQLSLEMKNQLQPYISWSGNVMCDCPRAPQGIVSSPCAARQSPYTAHSLIAVAKLGWYPTQVTWSTEKKAGDCFYEGQRQNCSLQSLPPHWPGGEWKTQPLSRAGCSNQLVGIWVSSTHLRVVTHEAGVGWAWAAHAKAGCCEPVRGCLHRVLVLCWSQLPLPADTRSPLFACKKAVSAQCRGCIFSVLEFSLLATAWSIRLGRGWQSSACTKANTNDESWWLGQILLPQACHHFPPSAP